MANLLVLICVFLLSVGMAVGWWFNPDPLRLCLAIALIGFSAWLAWHDVVTSHPRS